MASLQAKIDGVKTAASSTSTCTAATLVTLKELVLPENDTTVARSKSTAKSAKTPATSRTRPAATGSRATAPAASNAAKEDLLKPKERAALATHVINVTMKTLSEAAKPAPLSTPSKRSAEPQRPSDRKPLRRSASAPMSPLQPRTLNRVATSPLTPTKSSRVTHPAQSTGCLTTAECARVAFAALRAVKGPIKADQTDFQLEIGMSTFVGKLLALNMHEQALKEMKILKRRLDGSGAAENSSSPGFAELLEYHTPIADEKIALVTSCQIHVLKLASAIRKPAYIESLLPVLDESHCSSPATLLAAMAKQNPKETAKAARQLASLSQTLLSLAPSVSSKEDHVATEPRLSVSPLVAIELQTLAFKAQLRWWKLADHQGKLEDEVLAPLARCFKCLVRRQHDDATQMYTRLAASFNSITSLAQSYGYQTTASTDSPLATLYHLIGAAAHVARQHEEAHRWYHSLKDLMDPQQTPAVRIYSVSARLLAVDLKSHGVNTDTEQLIQEVTDGLDGSLSGTVLDLNELLESLSMARRAVVGVLMNKGDGATSKMPESLVHLLRTFILRYPRFVRRWLGVPPGRDAAAKQVLQFDQRRQLLMQSIAPTFDATLVVVKGAIQDLKEEWQLLDEVLQDCIALLNGICDPIQSAAKADQLGNYFVKISCLYFAKYAQLRREQHRSKEANKTLLQSLNRSIDCVKDRPSSEQDRAQLLTKLELFADLCRTSGRTEEATRTLRCICTNMAEDGVLSEIASSLSTQSPVVAWAMSEKAATMSRTLRSIARLDKSWNDWTFFLPEPERAAVLEHLVHVRADKSTETEPLRLSDSGLTTLLRLYAVEKYPIRRLRVLLQLFYQNLGDEDELCQISQLLQNTIAQAQQKDKGEDAGLVSFLPHHLAHHAFVSALAETSGESFAVSAKEAVASWKSLLAQQTTEEALLQVIDDPETMLDHLRSGSQFSDLRGEVHLQLAILELSNTISKVRSTSAVDGLVSSHSLLAKQYVTIGSFTKALKALDQAKELSAQTESVSQRIMVDFYVAEAEYLIGIGDMTEASHCLSKASAFCNGSRASWAQSKSQATLTLAMISLLQSTVALQGGDVQASLSLVKTSVRMLSHEWARLESSVASAGADDSTTSDASTRLDAPKTRVSGPRYWTLAYPLLRSLLHISSVYAHIGMFQETMYYTDAAWKIAEGTESPLYKAQISNWKGSVYVRANKLDKALPIFNNVKAWIPRDVCSARVRFARQLGDFYREAGEDEEALVYFTMAEETAHLLEGKQLSADSVSADIEKPKAVVRATRTTRATKTTRARPTAAPARATKRVTSAKAKPQTAVVEVPELPKDVYQASLLAAIFLSRAMGHIQQRDWNAAFSTLDRVKDLPKLLATLSQEQVIMATSLIGHSMEQMIHDPVFSVMQDSTISFPSVATCVERNTAEKASPDRSPPATSKARVAAGKSATTTEDDVPAFADALRKAQELLLDVHATALQRSDSSMVHKISAMLQNTIIFLSATATTKSKAGGHCGFAPVAVDLARNVAWKRERKTLNAPGEAPCGGVQATCDAKRRRSSFGLSTDMAKFQKTYVEMIPKNWSVVSVSLGNNQQDLCITKFQAGHSPFILRLPLERANSRDADSEIFNFEHGRDELLDIIKQANDTSHSARDFTARGERNAWWAEREALDTRLGELLKTIETTWLGGFKGIFSQHPQRPDLLARFQKSFHRVLDGCLPSRSRVRGKKSSKSPSITLDPRILDLFIGLGDPTDPDCDFDEALNDLLYFVVDVLQFHGERNAYDEIDFDAMVVETYDALRGYYAAAKSTGPEKGAHTVLVLDKALHAFPWESMPCMEKLAVSRVPSLACLRQMITDAKPSARACSESEGEQSCHQPKGHYVSADSGTYILNPSADLKNTQSFFQSSFTSLQSWSGIVKKEPEESDFEKALSDSEVLLYFGHGSGAQYVRGKTIRRLEKCRPATFLMGCSSAALTEVGEFECYGPVWNYMMAGCPAVVGTLWDVTDRDIDRFAGRAFEEWGLFPRGTFKDKDEKKGKGRAMTKKVDEKDEEGDYEEVFDEICQGLRRKSPGAASPASLSEAVTKARAACRLKYLNAAAVVLYGIPVYIDKET